MSNEVWKEFDDNQLTHSAAHYLMTIHELLEGQGYARVTDIAKRLNITRGSCSISLKPLKKRGLILEDDNRFLLLSEEGKRLALIVERNDELLETLFRDILRVDADQAEIDACKIEHLLSIESSLKLGNFIDFLRSDDPAAKTFLKQLKEHTSSSACCIESCPTCSDTCIYEQPLTVQSNNKD